MPTDPNEFVTGLPVEAALPALRDALAGGGVAVLQAPAGAGKSTVVPISLQGAPWLRHQRIVMLEPRRIAARAVARRMAQLVGEAVGGTIGYRVRGETRVGRTTRIEVVTEGVLTRILQRDPTLEGIGLVIFDEFHERSVHADLGLALTLHSRALIRPDLRILVMSATLDGERVAALLGGAPLVTTEGRAYDVDVRYLSRAPEQRIEPAVASAVRRALAEESGDVLAFLPGGGEIRRTAEMLTDVERAGVHVLPLYGDLPAAAQDAAIAPTRGVRRVVLATAIAETSLTIEGVRVVVDSGMARAPRFDVRTGMTRLETVRVSRASSEQRRGRAGRVAPGVCYRLWHEHEQAGLLPFTPPEILRTDLAPLALELAAAGVGAADELRWLDPPPARLLEQARELLVQLGALSDAGAGARITPHGLAMAELPVHPRLAHMLLRGRELGALKLACELAALLGERDVLRGDAARDANVELRLEWIRRGDLSRVPPDVDRGTLARVIAEARALRDQLGGREARHSGVESTVDAGVLLAFAYPDRIAQRRDSSGAARFVLRNGSGAVLPQAQGLSATPYLVAAELGGETGEARIYLGAALTVDEIERHFAEQITTLRETSWDDDERAIRAFTRDTLGAVVLRERHERASADETRRLLLDHIRREGLDSLGWTDDSRQLRNRIAFVRAREPERWPDVSDAALLAQLDEWLAPRLEGVSTIAALARASLRDALRAMLSWEQQRELDRRAPESFVAPTGTRAMIDYSDPEQPTVEVRLQEMFGVAVTPTVDGGRVPLTLRLLSPARRPIQVTRDLAGFWRGSYSDVRKEMRGRYPKHPWPDNPLNAAPTTRAKPRGS